MAFGPFFLLKTDRFKHMLVILYVILGVVFSGFCFQTVGSRSLDAFFFLQARRRRRGKMSPGQSRLLGGSSFRNELQWPLSHCP